MRRVASITAVIFIAVLVATAIPASASHTVTVSEHTTDSDFNAGTLTNFTVNGTGDSASLEVADNRFEDDVSTPGMSSTLDQTDLRGIVVETGSADVHDVRARQSSGCDALTYAEIQTMGGTTVASTSMSGGWANFTNAELDPNTKYVIAANQDGSTYTGCREDTGTTPYTSQQLDIVNGWNSGGGETSGVRYNIEDVHYAYSNGTVDSAEYISDTHDGSDIEQGVINISLTGSTATVEWQGNDGTGWTTVTTNSYTTDGEKTASLSGNYDQWRVVASVDTSDPSDDAEIYSDRIEFTASDPEIDNSSADPPNGAAVSESTTFTINVSDVDFSTVQDDTVTATLYVDGNAVGTDTLQSNGTASVQHSVGSLGDTDYYWTASDSYGDTSQSATFTISTPSELTFRREDDPDTLVTGANATATFYYDDGQTTVTRSDDDNDGKIDLAGLPNTEFIIEVNADGYHARTVYLQSIYDQQNIYLLNTSNASVETRFTLDDPTGEFDSETLLYVKKPVNVSGTVQYETMHADRFGVEGVTATLWENERYQIHIRSTDGSEQKIGPYRADTSETVTVKPGSPTVDLSNRTDGWGYGAELDNRTLEYRYSDPDDLTTSLTVFIHEKGNKSNQLTANKTYVDLGNVSAQETLTANESEKTWVVVFDVDRDGESFVVEEEVSNMADLVPSFNDRWRHFIGLAILFISAGAFSLLNRGVGAVVTAVMGGLLYWTGWLGGATAGIAVLIAIFIAVLYNIYTTSGP